MDSSSINRYVTLWCDLRGIKNVDCAFFSDILPYAVVWKDKQIISLSKFIKERIAKRQGWGKPIEGKFQYAFERLCKQGILKKIEKNAYQVNPTLTGNRHVFRIHKINVTFDITTGLMESVIE